MLCKIIDYLFCSENMEVSLRNKFSVAEGCYVLIEVTGKFLDKETKTRMKNIHQRIFQLRFKSQDLGWG